MTCIIGIEQEGKVWMGGDSAAADGWNIRQGIGRKVFVVGDVLMGYTTSFRMGQLLQYGLTMPKQECEDGMEFLVASFVPAVRELLAQGGFTTIENNVEVGGQFLMGYGGKLYEVNGDFAVLRRRDGYDAVGCGAQYALGALRSTGRLEAEARIFRALEVAAYFSNGVCGPFYVESL